jgi:hypothetical protein
VDTLIAWGLTVAANPFMPRRFADLRRTVPCARGHVLKTRPHRSGCNQVPKGNTSLAIAPTRSIWPGRGERSISASPKA